MLRSLALLAVVAALTGCFGDDPPASPAGAGGSTSAAGSTTSTTAASSTTAPRLGSTQRPVPAGQPFALNVDWTLQVRSFADEGPRTTTTTTRLAGTTTTDPFGTSAPPPPASVRLGLTISYAGVYPQSHLTSLRLGVVGSTAVPYRAGPCPSSVPDPLDLSGAVPKGQSVTGTACFLVERADAGNLVLFARAGTQGRDAFFALPSR